MLVVDMTLAKVSGRDGAGSDANIGEWGRWVRARTRRSDNVELGT
jgi:hypothetical protein